jgi:hypothetical protein
MQYPVVDRISLRGHTDVATGKSVPATVIWWRHSAAPDRVVPLALLLLIAATMHAVAAVRWAWPRAVPAGPIDRTRFLRLTLDTATWTSPAALLALSAFWPLASLWGTAAYEAFDRRGVATWIADTSTTRAMIGAGLTLGFSCVSLGVARALLNRMLRRGSLAGVEAPPTTAVCLACGYAVDAETKRCPECGGSLDVTERVTFIWPRVLGVPTRSRRRRVRIVLAGLSVGMVSAPLVIGVMRGAVAAVI